MKKNYIALFSFVLLIILVNHSYSQYRSVDIFVYDENNQPLPGAHVIIRDLRNDKLIKVTSDANGHANVMLGNHKYMLTVSYVGFEKFEKEIIPTEKDNKLKVVLKPLPLELDAVTIVSSKPIMKMEEDKLIINPEPLSATSSNSLEILENTPGIFVDPDGNVYISGMRPAVIYINGKEQKLRNEDLAVLLKSIQPDAIEKIEIIKSPSSKYEASTSGGIVNIVLKKGYRLGRSSSVFSSVKRGKYNSAALGFSFNNSNELMNIYLNGSYSHDDSYEQLKSQRILPLGNLINQNSFTRPRSNLFSFSIGLGNNDNSKKISLYDDIRINVDLKNVHSTNLNDIENVIGEVVLKNENNFNNESNYANLQNDFGFSLKLDTNGSVWDNKLNYMYNKLEFNQEKNTIYTLPYLIDFDSKTKNIQNSHFFNFQSDLTLKIPFEIIMETGIKNSIQYNVSENTRYTNNNQFTLFGNDINDNYNYTEVINSGYFQLNRKLLWNVNVKTGVRGENDIFLSTYGNSDNYKLSNFNLFPYLFFSRKLVNIMKIELTGNLIYRKTIKRPSFRELNPFVKVLDEYLYEKGNPQLKPQMTNNYEFNISFNNYPVFAIGYSEIDNIFSMVTYSDSTYNRAVIYRTYDNLGKSKELYVRGIAGIPPGGFYFFGIGGEYNIYEYSGLYQQHPFSYKRANYRFFTFHSLKISKNCKLFINGFLITKGMWNLYELDRFGQLNAGINYNFMKDKLSLNISFRDILKTMETKFKFNQADINTTGSRYMDNRKIAINIRYNFGIKINKKEEKKDIFKENNNFEEN